jgi:hypothetical protein
LAAIARGDSGRAAGARFALARCDAARPPLWLVRLRGAASVAACPLLRGVCAERRGMFVLR